MNREFIWNEMMRLYLVAAWCFACQGWAVESAVHRVAVLDFRNLSEHADWEPLGRGIADLLTAELGTVPGVQAMERSEFQKIWEELSLSALNADRQPRLGELLAADYLIVGSCGEADGKLRMDVRLVDTRTTFVRAVFHVLGDRETFPSMAQELKAKILGALDISSKEQASRSLPSFESVIARGREQPKGDPRTMEKALDIYRKAFAIDPRYEESRCRIQMAAALNSKGFAIAGSAKKDGARKIWTCGDGITAFDNVMFKRENSTFQWVDGRAVFTDADAEGKRSLAVCATERLGPKDDAEVVVRFIDPETLDLMLSWRVPAYRCGVFVVTRLEASEPEVALATFLVKREFPMGGGDLTPVKHILWHIAELELQTGKVRWTMPLYDMGDAGVSGGKIHRNMVVVDLDGDGCKDILVRSNASLFALDGRTKETRPTNFIAWIFGRKIGRQGRPGASFPNR